eukprot:TRINITY_DN8570_c0_g1_i1.p1 TRINITY_DN8570_c0_g1~~TRINITY_DN8570_c0_g1_i1.p1  ORF type:complete len:365 (+),score=70.34 TRINITY_DN8570_c0_g1_i1:53-1147(+)
MGMTASLLVMLLLVVVSALGASAKNEGPVTTTYDGGYVFTTQFKCVNLNCSVCELEVAALSRETASPVVLLTIWHKALPNIMRYPVFTAFDPATRSFAVLGNDSLNSILWMMTVSADGRTADNEDSNGITQLPDALGWPVSLHFGPQSRLFAVLEEAYLIELTYYGRVINLTPILPGVTMRLARSERASVVDPTSGLLYAALRDKTTSQHTIVTFDLNANRPIANHSLTVGPGDDIPLVLQTAFHAVFDNSTNALYWFVTGRLDQILRVDPRTGVVEAMIADLSRQGYFFFSNSTARPADTFQMQAVDPVAKRVYMQVSTRDPVDSGVFWPNLVSWDLGGESLKGLYANTTVGLSGFYWVPTQQ